MAKAAHKKRKRKRRGPLPVLAAGLAAGLVCWSGLATVDRRIRAVTINQSPPLWEVRPDAAPEGEGKAEWELWALGHRLTVDLGPLRRAGDELALILRTPPAPARLLAALFQALPPAPRLDGS